MMHSITMKLEFVDIACQRPAASGGRESFCKIGRRRSNDMILRGVSGSALPGGMVAVMGSSGCGKTTLLDVLGGVRKTKVSGTVNLNESCRSKTVGYIRQRDCFISDLTVHDILKYEALIKLGRKMNFKQKMGFVQDAIEDGGLERCRNAVVRSSVGHGGVSGGEMKRLSLACMLMMKRSVLLLDEPTSGMDSDSALEFVSCLESLATRRKLVVMCVIHQPSAQILEKFPRLIWMEAGELLYQGGTNDVEKYLMTLGFTRPSHLSIMEFLSQLSRNIGTCASLSDAYKKNIRCLPSGLYDVYHELNCAELPLGSSPASSVADRQNSFDDSDSQPNSDSDCDEPSNDCAELPLDNVATGPASPDADNGFDGTTSQAVVDTDCGDSSDDCAEVPVNTFATSVVSPEDNALMDVDRSTSLPVADADCTDSDDCAELPLNSFATSPASHADFSHNRISVSISPRVGGSLCTDPSDDLVIHSEKSQASEQPCASLESERCSLERVSTSGCSQGDGGDGDSERRLSRDSNGRPSRRFSTAHDIDAGVPLYATQFYWLFRRTLRGTLTQSMGSLALCQMLIPGLFLGLVMFQNVREPSEDDLAKVVFGLIFVGVFSGVHSAFIAINLLYHDVDLYSIERSTSAYPLSAFFLAHSLARMVRQTLSTTGFFLIATPLMGMRMSPSILLSTWALLMLIASVGDAAALLVWSCVKSEADGRFYVLVFVKTSSLLGGMFAPQPNIPVWLRWLPSVFPWTYAGNVVAQNVLWGMNFRCSTSNPGKCPISCG
eukprot:GHVS01068077.1.p1 GENE.GHVS01068077.1~~GHVS01068077.1.p1  ORF type:complete len:778 (+),score=64.01 GHVS01068077.1:124-2457(+)